MANVSIARRYARALIDLGAEGDRLDTFTAQLQSFAGAISGSAELTDVLVNPAFSRPQRLAVTDGLIASLGGFEPEVQSFLRLLVDRNRMMNLPDIVRVFRDLADAKVGRLRGRVTTAVPLPKASEERLAALLAQLTRQEVVLETRVDPEILGGVAAQVGSVLYDGSLRTQLEELRRTLRA